MTNFLKKLLGGTEKLVLTGEHQKCLDILEKTQANLFITGKAGTGKSTLVQHFRNTTKKKNVVLAPTGIAALNVRGQTIHSFFKFPPRLIDSNSVKRMSNTRLYTDLDCVIIDEISMVRADLLDGIDRFLRLNGKDRNLPFGGIQMVFVGDLYQLPPVLRSEEMVIYSDRYASPYFFSAQCLGDSFFHIVELTTVFRQKEEEFIEILNKIRVGDVSMETLKLINERVSDRKVDDSGKIVEVETDEWENVKYELDDETGEIKADVKGRLRQYPLKLAWAITIHKSQGMSFTKVCLDFSRSPFAHGQTYVALSRCRTLGGLVLTKKIYPNDILIDEKIIEFYNKI